MKSRVPLITIRTRSPLPRRIARVIGRRLLRWGENNEVLDRDRNGEGWLLRELLAEHARVSGGRPFVLFDVGANVGDYSELALRFARETGCAIEVHAFEPASINVTRLRERFAGKPAVKVVPAAVGENIGVASLYDGKGGSSLASLVPRGVLGDGLGEIANVPVIRLDQYLAEHGVSKIDLLKLDVEGFELAALRGFGEKLNGQRVDMIQFEYGGAALDAGITLGEIAAYVAKADYALAKLFPAALELREYHAGLEHYAYSNYVALSSRWLPASAARQ